MRRTIDTYTGLSFSFNETTRHAGSGLIVPACTTRRSSTMLHPSRCLPDLLRELNPHATRSTIEHWKTKESDT